MVVAAAAPAGSAVIRDVMIWHAGSVVLWVVSSQSWAPNCSRWDIQELVRAVTAASPIPMRVCVVVVVRLRFPVWDRVIIATAVAARVSVAHSWCLGFR